MPSLSALYRCRRQLGRRILRSVICESCTTTNSHVPQGTLGKRRVVMLPNGVRPCQIERLRSRRSGTPADAVGRQACGVLGAGAPHGLCGSARASPFHQRVAGQRAGGRPYRLRPAHSGAQQAAGSDPPLTLMQPVAVRRSATSGATDRFLLSGWFHCLLARQNQHAGHARNRVGERQLVPARNSPCGLASTQGCVPCRSACSLLVVGQVRGDGFAGSLSSRIYSKLFDQRRLATRAVSQARFGEIPPPRSHGVGDSHLHVVWRYRLARAGTPSAARQSGLRGEHSITCRSRSRYSFATGNLLVQQLLGVRPQVALIARPGRSI